MKSNSKKIATFSDAPTLLEELGYDYLSTELQKQSKFYRENFY